MELMTLKEAVQELFGKISLSTLYLAVESKALPHYRVSGRGRAGKILVKRADLLAWLEGQRVGEVEETTLSRPTIKKLRHLSVD